MSPRPDDQPILRRENLSVDPLEQFAAWYAEAQEKVPLAEAMTLATVDAEGSPDARMVLLKGHGPDGFRFFTNYQSNKAKQLDAAGRAALILYWREQDRQVRVRGAVSKVSPEDSDAYFASRPRNSQLGAWASPQSREVSVRAELELLYTEMAERFGTDEVTRPEHWGGYLVTPDVIEFWQGQSGRMHDRFVYTPASGSETGWKIERLGP